MGELQEHVRQVFLQYFVSKHPKHEHFHSPIHDLHDYSVNLKQLVK